MGQAVRHVTVGQVGVSVRRIGAGLGWSTAGGVVLRLGNLATSIIVARLISPTEFGVFAVALTVWTICGTMAEFGLGSDLVRARDLERRIPTVAAMGLLTSGTLAVGMFAGAGLIASAFDSPAAVPVIRVMSISMLVFGLSIVPAAILQRDFRQGRLFAINAVGMIVSTTTIIALAIYGLGPMALAIGQVAGQCVIVAAQYAVTGVSFHLGFDRQIARESALFCLPLALANMLSWALLSVDNLIVSRIMGPTQLGFYALAFNVSSWPMNAVGQSIRVVALPAFAHLATNSLRNRAMTLISGPVWTVSILMGLCLSTLAWPMISLLYGGRWSPAAIALIGLGAFGAVRVVFDLIATFLIALGTTRAVLIVQIWWLTAMVPAMWVGVAHFGLRGAGWAHVLVAIIAVLPAYLYCLQRVGVSAVAFMRGAIPPLVIAVPASIICAMIARHISMPLLAVGLGGISALALFAVTLGPWIRGQIKLLRSTEATTL